VAVEVARIWPFDDCFAVSASASLTFGLRRGHRRVAFKAYGTVYPAANLEEVRAVHRSLYEEGFPSPEPLLGPVPLGRTGAVVDAWVDDGEFRDLHEPRLRRLWAARLAELVALASRHVDVALPRLYAGLWDRPHNPRFDFARADGRWIDEAAAGVREIVYGPVADWVVGHCDWNAQHVRWRGDEVAVVYDWDSVVRDSEANLVGFASAVFPATWELDVPKAPTAAEAEAFVAEYEEAARRALDRSRVAAARTFIAVCRPLRAVRPRPRR